MTKSSVRISELKAHLSEHLKTVRKGHVITVLDRDQPIAQLVPYASSAKPVLNIRKGNGKRLADIEMPPPPKRKMKVTTLDLLLEDRRKGR